MDSEPQYWFPAKRYGWGWGLPVAWQGWLVIGIFIALLIAGVFMFPPNRSLGKFVLFVFIVNILFVAVCWLKGEPPRWRWGDDRG